MTANKKADLLAAADAKLQRIADRKFGHRRLAEVYDLLDLYLSPAIPEQIVMLIGPSRVGKTTLLKTILNDRLRSVDQDHKTTVIPAIYVRADSAQGEEYPFVNLYEDWLNQLDERGVKSTGEFIEQTVLGMVVRTFLPTALRTGKIAMRYKNRVRDGMKARGCGLAILDEASHLITASGGNAQIAGDELKTLVEGLDARLLLAGSYELFHLKMVSAQLDSRIKVVFLMPYEIADSEDLKEFTRIVDTSLTNLPFEHRVTVTPDFVKLVMRGTLGLTGWWVRVVLDACNVHLKSSKPFDEALLISCLPNRLELQVHQREIQIIQCLENQDLEGALALGFADFYRAPAVSRSPSTKGKGKRGRVGQRRLGRDPVGS